MSKLESKKKILQGGRTKFKKQISESSKQYLLRQAKDPYVKEAQKKGYRSRAAFKLIQLQEKHNLMRSRDAVVDLGSAPGSWCQVAREYIGKNGTVVAIDRIWMPPLEGVEFLKGDFAEDDVYEELKALCPNKIDLVLSDLAPETTGHFSTDHIRSMALVEMAADFATEHLKKGGHFVAKIFQGGEEVEFRKQMRKIFTKAEFEKPDSSRKGSREMFIVCKGFKG